MAKNVRPIPGSRAESLLDQLLTEVKGLRADLAKRADVTVDSPPPGWPDVAPSAIGRTDPFPLVDMDPAEVQPSVEASSG